jgi:hypothetical protein
MASVMCAQLRHIAGLLGALLLLLGATQARAADGPWLDRDTLLTVAARRALLRDLQLKSLNVGVSVRQGTAVLWGPIPSAQLEQRAVAQVRQVVGVTAVRSELEIVPRDVLLESLAPDPVKSPLGELTSRPREAPEAATPLRSAVTLLPPVPVKPPPAPQEPPAVLLRPIPRPTLPVEPSPTSPVVPPSEPPSRPAPSNGPSSLLLAIAQVRQSDEHYRRVQVEVRGGVVTLRRGVGARNEDVMALARAVSRLAGVERVVVAPR